MLLDINNLENIKFCIHDFSAKERIQLIYSLVYFGYSIPFTLDYVNICNIITCGWGYLYLNKSLDSFIEYGSSIEYFEEYNIITNPRDLIIKDIVMTSFSKTPDGIFINDHGQCREIKLNKTDVMSYRTGKIHSVLKYLLDAPIVYSRSLNSYMIENICKGI